MTPHTVWIGGQYPGYIEPIFKARKTEKNVKAPQQTVLEVLRDNPGVSVRQLLPLMMAVKDTGATMKNVQNALDRLKIAGLATFEDKITRCGTMNQHVHFWSAT